MKIDEGAINHYAQLAVRDIVGGPEWICDATDGMDLVRIEALAEIRGVLLFAGKLKELLLSGQEGTGADG